MIESKSLGVLDHPHSRGRTVLYPDAPSTSVRAERSNPCIRAASMDCFVARAPRNDEERLSLMAHHVDDNSIGIPDEKSPDAPWLVGQGIHDRTALLLRGRVARVDVAHLDADIRVRFIPRIGRHDADLSRRVRRR